MTAFIIVGSSHIYHGGIYPERMLRLHENSRPGWVLPALPSVQALDEPAPAQTVWIPTVDGMLEDGLLMLVLCIFQPPDLIEKANRMFRCDWKERAELHENIDQTDLVELRELSRQFPLPGKIVVTVLMESHLLRQISRIKDYPWEAEVCTWQYARIRPWGTVEGKLADGTTIRYADGNPFTLPE